MLKVMHILGGRYKCGVATHVFNLAQGLKNEIDIILVLFHQGEVEQEAKKQGIRTIRLKRKIPGDPHFILDLVRLIKKENPNIIHTHTINSNFYGRLTAFLSRYKVITTVHTYMHEAVKDLYKSVFIQKLVLWQNDFTAKYADGFIATSLGIKNVLLKKGIPAHKIYLIYNGLDWHIYEKVSLDLKKVKNKLGIKEGEKVVGCISRLVPIKGISSLLFAIHRLSKIIPNIKVLIVGEGPLKADLEFLARKLKINDKVIFTGFCQDILPCLKVIDVFVIPSFFESCPYSLLEAMAMGKPVVARAVGSLPEIIEADKTGILFQNDEELIDAMARLLQSPYLGEKMGKEAKRRIKDKFSLEKMCFLTKKVYFQILRSKR
ncbi:glycosyltransferase [Desulfothermus sp.]